MEELRVELTGGAHVELANLAVTVTDGGIAFTVEGVIQDISQETLEAFSGMQCTPSAVEFKCS